MKNLTLRIVFIAIAGACVCAQISDCEKTGNTNLCIGAPCISDFKFWYQCSTLYCDDATDTCQVYPDVPSGPEINIVIDNYKSSVFPWWAILIICVVVVIAIVVVIIVVKKCIAFNIKNILDKRQSNPSSISDD